MKRILLFLLFFVFVHSCYVYALDWKRIHETTDKTSIAELKNLQDNSPENLYLAGLVYLNAYEIGEAQEYFDRFYEISPDAPEARWSHAEMLRRRHKRDESERILKEIINSNPDFYPAYISLAYIRYTKSDFVGSIKLANQVLQADSDKVDVSNTARAYLLVAGDKGMIAHYGGPIAKIINGSRVLPNLRKAQSLQPNSAGVLFALGSYYLLIPPFAGRDLDKAEDYLNQTIKRYPLFADAYVRLAQLYRLKKDEKNFDKYIQKALEIDPGNELAIDIKGGTCKFVCVSAD